MSTTLVGGPNGLARLDGTGVMPTAQLPPGGGAHPDLATHDTLGLATDDALAAHEADTTAIHGITSTAALVLTDDARLTDARTPLSHVHVDGDIPAGIARDAEVATVYATIHTHPYEASGAVATHAGLPDPHPGYLTPAEGDVAYAALAHTHAGGAYAPGSFTVADGTYAQMVKRLALTTTQRVTLAGSARLRID